MKSLIAQKLGLALAMTFFIVSCTENVSYNEEATRMYLPTSFETSGLAWFKPEMDTYKPDTSIINQIKTVFDSTKHKILLYADFTCSCTSKQSDIADMCRVLSDAKIDTSHYEIYSIRNSTNNHPHKNQFTLVELPQIVVLKDTTAVFFVMDSVRYYRDIIHTNAPIEKFLLDGLKK